MSCICVADARDDKNFNFFFLSISARHYCLGRRNTFLEKLLVAIAKPTFVFFSVNDPRIYERFLSSS